MPRLSQTARHLHAVTQHPERTLCSIFSGRGLKSNQSVRLRAEEQSPHILGSLINSLALRRHAITQLIHLPPVLFPQPAVLTQTQLRSICRRHFGRQSSKPILLDLGCRKVHGESDYPLVIPVVPATKQTVQGLRYERVPGPYSATPRPVSFMISSPIVDTGQWAFFRRWQAKRGGVRTRRLGRLHQSLA